GILENQHFQAPANVALREIARIQELFEPGGVVPALLETEQLAVELEPIVQSADIQLARLAYQTLLAETIETSRAQPDCCYYVSALGAVDVDLSSLIPRHLKPRPGRSRLGGRFHGGLWRMKASFGPRQVLRLSLQEQPIVEQPLKFGASG